VHLARAAEHADKAAHLDRKLDGVISLDLGALTTKNLLRSVSAFVQI